MWKNFKKSFTLFELILIIVVVGIIVGISSNFFLSLYTFYDETRSFTKRDLELSNTLLITSKHLRNRLEDSAIAREKSNINNYTDLTNLDTSYTNTNSLTYNLEWIGVDNDSFNGMYNSQLDAVLPLWSGFIDISSSESNSTQIYSAMSDTENLQIFINSLSLGKIDIFDKTQSIAMFFKTQDLFDWSDPENYSLKVYAESGKKEYFFPARDDFVPDGETSFLLYEQYQLSWSAYSLSFENNQLYLYWNYRPWNGENFTNGIKSLLLQNVSSFNFFKIGKRLKVEICVDKEETLKSPSFEICREVIIY